MKSLLKSKTKRVFSGIAILAVVALAYNHFFPLPGSPEADLQKADSAAFLNNWIGAAGNYQKAESGFRRRGDLRHALYTEVSQIPARMESSPLPALIAETEEMLRRPEASYRYVRLRILTVKGMLELEYETALAQNTWKQVEQLARHEGQLRLASRADGPAWLLRTEGQSGAHLHLEHKAFRTARAGNAKGGENAIKAVLLSWRLSCFRRSAGVREGPRN